MATTKLKISEQILRLLNSGDVTNDNDIDIREIILAVEQERDRLVRLRLFESLQLGEMIVAGDVISSKLSLTSSISKLDKNLTI